MSDSELQDTERECLAKFHARARKLAASNPDVSSQILFAMAAEQMPRTFERYQHVRGLLQLRGIAAQPLR